MFKRTLQSIVLIGLFFGCTESKAQVDVVIAFPNLSFQQPVDIQSPDDGTNRLFVLSQLGIIHVFENDADVNSSTEFLNISNTVVDGGERGLLGLAFHPSFSDNGYFFVDYTTGNPLKTRISRFSVSADDPNKADPNSELVLLEVNQPFSNHNGGQVSFGPDGYLYVAFGDGGSGGDPQNNAQNRGALLGSIIRIDVNESSENEPYKIPSDNPFAGNSEGYREEIYAYGLRNVWRFSFGKDGQLWAADVGQNLWEEINLIAKGKNYGWRIMEGNHCYNPSSNCDQTGLELPVWEYYHNSNGGYSITGGFVYSGLDAAELLGKYIYGDFVTGNIWALSYESGEVSNELIDETNYAISTFGLDANKELYFADYNSGRIYKFDGEQVSDMGDLSPGDFKLYQNYPNPFNPDTKLTFTNDKPQFIGLTVYDSLGRKVTTLVDEYKQPGFYEVTFDGGNLATGIYYYRLQSNSITESKKMMLLR